MAGERGVNFLVTLRPNGNAFAVVVFDGDESVCDSCAVELPFPMTTKQAVAFAVGCYGARIARDLAAKKPLPYGSPGELPSPEVEYRERTFPAEMTFEQLRAFVRERMSLVAPELTTKDKGEA
jgi:hypothetical protein